MKETDSVTKERRLRFAARARLLARLRAQPAIDVGRWTRDELYADATYGLHLDVAQSDA
jgi:hypothetical protein